MREIIESTINKIDYYSLIKMKIHTQHGGLRHDSTDIEYDLEEYNTTINNIIEICHAIKNAQ